MSAHYRNILIIKPGAVGDLLQMTPVVRALGRRFPGCSITLLVGSDATAALFRNDPRVSRTVVYDRRGRRRSAGSFFRLWRGLRAGNFDLVVNFQRSNLRTWLLTAAALPCRILVYHKARRRNVHAVVNYLETLAPLGIAPEDTRLELCLDDDARRFAAEAFSSPGLNGRPVIALNPGATHAVNRWPPARFAGLADLIAERLHAGTIIIGGPDDGPLAEEIVSRSRSGPLNLVGRTSLLELGGVLERCAALVSGDTGPLHLATAVGTPVVALFGAADPERTGPIGPGHVVIRAQDLPCVPCRSRTCANSVFLECMQKISAERVLEGIEAVLRKAR